MNILFLFISWSFSALFFVFYRFSQQSQGENITSLGEKSEVLFSGIFGSLIYESVLFFVLGVVLCLIFSSRKKQEKSLELEEIGEKSHVTMKQYLKIFFQKYIYYLGFLLFYLSIFFILRGLGFYSHEYLVFVLNVLVGLLFFLSKRSEISRDFIKVNIILFSLYYMIEYMRFFFGFQLDFTLLSRINNFITWFLFLGYMIFDMKILKKNSTDTVLFVHFCIYSFVSICFYVFYLSFLENAQILQVLIVISLIFSLALYHSKKQFLEKYIYLMRGVSFVFLYIATICSFAFLLKQPTLLSVFDMFLIILIFYSIVFNSLVHALFENYISFIVSLISFIGIIYFLIIESFSLGINIFLITNIILAFFFILVTYGIKKLHQMDYYILHFFGYAVLFFGIAIYIYYASMNFVTLGILLSILSAYIFLSYFKLREISQD